MTLNKLYCLESCKAVACTLFICLLFLLNACDGGKDAGLLKCRNNTDCRSDQVCNDDGVCVASGEKDCCIDGDMDDEKDDSDAESESLESFEEESEVGYEDETEEEGDSTEADIEIVEDESENDDEEQPYEYAVKIINMPMSEILSAVPLFEEKGFIIYLNVTASHIGDVDFAEVLKEAKARNVPVKLWPLLTPEEGAWCNEDNMDIFISNLFDILDYVQTLEHNVNTVVVNSELGPPKIDHIRQYFAEGNLIELMKLLKDNINRKQFKESQLKIQEMIDEIHRRGFLAQITTYPYLLDDLIDSDSDIQDAANVILEGVKWDRLAFTPYSAAYTDDFDRPFGPYFVYSYSLMAREKYGRKADIALGLIAPGSTHAYETLEELAADVAAAKAAGIRRIDVFDLKGMMKDERFDEWAEALLAEAAVPDVEKTTIDFHKDFALADSLLDGINEE